VVTRTRKQASALSNKLRALGAQVVEFPTIRIEPPSDLRAFAELVQDAHVYDWIVFTSANGVDAFSRSFSNSTTTLVRSAARGSQPSAGYGAAGERLSPSCRSSAGRIRGGSGSKGVSKRRRVENLRILLVRAEKTRDVLPTELSGLGAIVDEAFAYRTVPETRDITGARRRLAKEAADLITFTSSSTVENFLALGLPWPKGMRVASIGPITSKTARDHGLTIDIEARRHDIEGLVQAICDFFAPRNASKQS